MQSEKSAQVLDASTVSEKAKDLIESNELDQADGQSPSGFDDSLLH